MPLFNPEVKLIQPDGIALYPFSMLEQGDKVLSSSGMIVEVGTNPELVYEPDATFVLYDKGNCGWFPEELQ